MLSGRGSTPHPAGKLTALSQTPQIDYGEPAPKGNGERGGRGEEREREGESVRWKEGMEFRGFMG